MQSQAGSLKAGGQCAGAAVALKVQIKPRNKSTILCSWNAVRVLIATR